MTRRKDVSWPLIFTGLYASTMIALQFVLGQAMPNTGMGGLAVTYVIWPAIVISILLVYWILCQLNSGRVLASCGLIIVGVVTLVAIYPQDDPLSFSEKIAKITQYILS